MYDDGSWFAPTPVFFLSRGADPAALVLLSIEGFHTPLVWVAGVERSVTRHSVLPLIPTLGFAAHCLLGSTTMRYLQFLNPFGGDFWSSFATQLHSLRLDAVHF